MDWEATELTDLDVTGIDHEGGFSALGVPDEIVAALAKTGITDPFRIQIAAIPDAIAGRDVLGRASTGSGKTLAFGVPLLSRLSAGPRVRHVTTLRLPFSSGAGSWSQVPASGRSQRQRRIDLPR